MVWITRIDADGMDAWPLGPVRSPFFALRVIPQRPVQLPRLAVIFGFEESTGHRSTPNFAGMVGAAGSESPDQFQRPIERLVEEGNWLRNITLGHRRIRRYR